MPLSQQSRTFCRFVRHMTSLATVSSCSPVSLLACEYGTMCDQVVTVKCCLPAAQRKGILDLYGEQALKAGMVESEPGD